MSTLLHPPSRLLPVLGGGVLLAALLLLPLFLLPPGAVWVTDNGNKYLQMRSFAEHGSTALTHPMPEFFPSGGFHFRYFRGEWRSFLPEVLPALSAPAYRLFGERGGAFWSLAGAALLLALFYCWRKDFPLTLLLLCGTPLWFYSELLWEMTPSCVFALGGMLLLLRGHPVGAGFLMGCGVWMREELYFFAGAGILALLVQREFRTAGKLGAGFLLGVLPVWGFLFWRSGHILGLHGALYHRNNAVPETWGQKFCGIGFNYFHHLFRFDAAGDLSRLLILPPLFGCLAGAFRKKGCPPVLFFAAWGCSFFLMLRLWSHPAPQWVTGVTMGAVVSLPVLWGCFFHWRKLLDAPDRKIRLLCLWVLMLLVLVPPFLTRADIGLTWGARHFLLLLPPALVLSKLGWGKKKLKFFLLCALLSAGLQFFSLQALYRVSRKNAEVEELVRSTGEKVVVSDVFFLPEQTPRLFFETLWLDPSAMQERTVAELKRAGIRSFVLLLSLRYRRLGDPALRKLLEYAPLVEAPKRLNPGDASELFCGICRVP